MADFDNPAFDKDDYDKDNELDEQNDLHADNEFNRTIQNKSAHSEDIGDYDLRTQLIVQKQYVVKEYNKLIKEKYGLDPVYILIIQTLNLVHWRVELVAAEQMKLQTY